MYLRSVGHFLHFVVAAVVAVLLFLAIAANFFFKHCMVATGQEMVRENKNSSRSGKSQGILFWLRENWHFEEKSGKIEMVRLI